MLLGPFGGLAMIGNLGAVGDFTIFFHTFCSNLQLKSHKTHFLYLLGTLCFCDVPQIIFEVIGVR